MELSPCVYVLCHPVTGEVRYIGQTAKSLSKRLSNHLYDSAKGKTYVQRWVARLIREGLAPDIVVWEVVPLEKLDERETFWITGFREHGHRLTNLASGGGGGMRGFKHSVETCAKIGAAKRGKFLTAEHKAKISASNTGKRFSAETKERMGAAKRGNKYWLGKTHTKEARAAISSAQQGSGNHRAVLTESAVWEIKELLHSSKHSHGFIADLYNVSRPTVSRIKSGKFWSHVAFLGGDFR